jgi:hypothetical protein
MVCFLACRFGCTTPVAPMLPMWRLPGFPAMCRVRECGALPRSCSCSALHVCALDGDLDHERMYRCAWSTCALTMWRALVRNVIQRQPIGTLSFAVP